MGGAGYARSQRRLRRELLPVCAAGAFQRTERRLRDYTFAVGRRGRRRVSALGNAGNRQGLTGPAALGADWTFPFDVGMRGMTAALGRQPFGAARRAALGYAADMPDDRRHADSDRVFCGLDARFGVIPV